jgi:uncharacterized paraquat-inducible protein A
MLGDNPWVIGLVLFIVVGLLAPKVWRARDARRCPQCRGLAVDFASRSAAGDVTCRRCGTELVRAHDGVLRRKVS